MKFQKNRILFFIYLGVIVWAFVGCEQNYIPKPYAYFRIDFPEKEYQLYESTYPFTFEYPVYGTVAPDTRPTAEPGWFNIRFPKYKGVIYLTYRDIDHDFDTLIENEWSIVYKKIAQKADAVDPYDYVDPEHNVYGTIYDIKGNAASSALFFVTDSVKHFLRGSLYIEVRPNADSLAPVVNFFREDVLHLMRTVRWKD